MFYPLYKWHINNKINKIKKNAKNEENVYIACCNKGGTSILAVLGAISVFVAVIMITIYLFVLIIP